jgi:hypothetical protein
MGSFHLLVVTKLKDFAVATAAGAVTFFNQAGV